MTVSSNGERPKTRTILVIAVCRLGILVVTLAYLLLFIATLVGIIFPKSNAGKYVALVAYLTLIVFFVYRTYRVWCRECGRAARREPKNGMIASKRASANERKHKPHKNSPPNPKSAEA